MLSAQRPSTSHGVPGGSQPGFDAAAEFGERPHTAEGNSHGSLATEMADGSFGAADQSGFDASEYRRRLDEFRQMSAPDLLGSCLLYTSPSPRDKRQSRMPSSA